MKNLILSALAKKQKWINNKTESSNSNEFLSSDDEEQVSREFIGTWYNKKYISLKYLGRGTFSRVWLVYNIEDENFYALKVVFDEFYEDSKHELEIINIINKKSGNLLHIYETFYENTQLCIVNELMGISLLDLLKSYEEDTIPRDLIKKIVKDLLKGLDELHSHNIVHTDIKPENILMNVFSEKIKSFMKDIENLKLSDKYNEILNSVYPEDIDTIDRNKKKKVKRKCKIKAQKKFTEFIRDQLHILPNNKLVENGLEITDMDDLEININDNPDNEKYIIDDLDNLVVKIIDFGNAECCDDRIQDEIQIREFRPPENIINDYYDCKSDIWTLGCIIYEMLTGDLLFDVEDSDKSINRDRNHLHKMYEILGKMPRDMTQNCDFSEDLFDSKGRILKRRNCEYTNIKDILIEDFEFEENDACEINDFLKNLLEYDVHKRISAKNCLNHVWLN